MSASTPSSAPRNNGLRLLDRFWTVAGQDFSTIADGEVVSRAHQAELLVRFYYSFLFFLSFRWVSADVSSFKSGKAPQLGLELWFSGFIPKDHLGTVLMLAALGVMFFGLVACVSPRQTWARAGAVGALFVHVGLQSDFKGKVDHSLHPAILAGIAFCFLPRLIESGEQTARRYLGAFFTAQVGVGLLYTCAGISKVCGIILDLEQGGRTWFSPDALPLTLVGQWNRTRETLLGGFLFAWCSIRARCSWSSFPYWPFFGHDCISSGACA